MISQLRNILKWKALLLTFNSINKINIIKNFILVLKSLVEAEVQDAVTINCQ